uniref:Uncharacterized protein n=1 Tax=Rhizophora mucronata TaxID=61149 RepID=A0A2P2PF77_RHIMU
MMIPQKLLSSSVSLVDRSRD